MLKMLIYSLILVTLGFSYWPHVSYANILTPMMYPIKLHNIPVCKKKIVCGSLEPGVKPFHPVVSIKK